MAMTLIPALRDNTMHGWIYGYGSILSTHNGGLTWVYETPNSLILGVAGTSATEILVRFRLSHFFSLHLGWTIITDFKSELRQPPPLRLQTMANVPGNY